MRCPHCNSPDIRVMDSLHGNSKTLYRRRKCKRCNKLFRTVEIVDDGSEAFDAKYYAASKRKVLKNMSKGDKK